MELVIDLGSRNTVIANRNGNIVFNQPTAVVLNNDNGNLSVVAVGENAVNYPKNNMHQLVYPIINGTIYNQKACELMLKYFLKIVAPKKMFKPNITAIVCVSCGLTNIEKKLFEETCTKAGIKEVIVVESPIAVAAISEKGNSFIVDIGEKKTEIALVTKSGITVGCSVDIGGASFDLALTDYMCDKHKISVSQTNAEQYKRGTASINENEVAAAFMSGTSFIDKQIKNIKITLDEYRSAVMPTIDNLVKMIEKISLMIPENIAQSVYENGIILCGGGAKLTGLDDYLSRKLAWQVSLLINGDEAAARGGANLFDKKQLLIDSLAVSKI